MTLPSMSETADSVYLSVSEAVKLLADTLEKSLPDLRISGEIFELKRAASGHLYFRLKDGESQIAAVMWNGTLRTLKLNLEVGLMVLCKGRPTVYRKQGTLQFVVSAIEQAGIGLLIKKFNELKVRLEKEGLFDPARKRPLPFLPKAIGIVTSSKGAVIQDMSVVLQDRMPQVKVFLIDVRVQGEGAAEDIASAISYFSSSGLVDLIIAGRGGGSLEDLWAFNEEVVVRAIFGSKVPVISAVGHEVDVTLADYVADLRAATPTRAAEMAVPKRQDLLRRLAELEKIFLSGERLLEPRRQDLDYLSMSLNSKINGVLEGARQKIMSAETRLKLLEPQSMIALIKSRLKQSEEKLMLLTKRSIERAHSIWRQLSSRLQSSITFAPLQVRKDSLLRDHGRLLRATIGSQNARRAALEATAARLQALSPAKVLERGFAVVEGSQGLVRNAEQVKIGEELTVRFFRGSLKAAVQSKMSS